METLTRKMIEDDIIGYANRQSRPDMIIASKKIYNDLKLMYYRSVLNSLLSDRAQWQMTIIRSHPVYQAERIQRIKNRLANNAALIGDAVNKIKAIEQ